MSRRDRVLVSTDWLQNHLTDPGLLILEVDERPLIFREAHIPGARCLDWRLDLQDAVSRDIPSGDAMAGLWRRIGLSPQHTVVFYGDRNNWWAAFAFWLFRYYGARDLRLLDGGRQAWLAEGRPIEVTLPDDGSPAAPPEAPRLRRRPALRAGWRDALAAIDDGVQLVDVRTPAEFRGEVFSETGYAHERAQRAGRIPSAVNLPWDLTVDHDGKLHADERLRAILREHGIEPGRPSITYCRIGERSAHTWFVLYELLGHPARNYDGSWVEWGSMIGMPVATGPQEPGATARRGERRAAGSRRDLRSASAPSDPCRTMERTDRS
jgi:thiosulfate/3-mercaptopyruvate sulfurtransferase